MLTRTLAFTTLLASVSATLITNDASVVAGKKFDYVIAGGGLSGIVVGTKLSAKGHSVLMVEAGKNLPDNPAIYNAELRGHLKDDPATDCNWHYTASADNGTALPVLIDSGKCVGGSSSINGMVWYRPTAAELDALETLGNPGWNAKSLYPYMTAIEHNIPPTAAQRADGANLVPAVHGFNGLVNVSFPVPMRIPEGQDIYKAALALVFGIQDSPDLSFRNGSISASTSWTIWWDPVAKITRRASAAYSLLYPQSQQRKSLIVLTEHKVARVLFKGTKATGMEFGPTDGGKLVSVGAKREVILAAGSLATPAILERSGVGNATFLKSMGIEPVVDLPGVGLNLQDQPGTGLSALVDNVNATNTELIDNRNIFAPVITLLNIDQLFGARASNISADLQCQVKKRAEDAIASGSEVNLRGALELFSVVTDLITKAKQPITELVGESYPAVMTAVFWPLTPLSRGHIHIQSTNYTDAPRITPRFLTDEFDVDTAVTISKRARAMYESAAFAPIIASAVVDAVAANATDAEWAEWYKGSSFGASHWLGSSSMRPRESGGVVSPELEVYGTDNLRVVDASILPFQITSHTMPAVYAISQKAVDLILA